MALFNLFSRNVRALSSLQGIAHHPGKISILKSTSYCSSLTSSSSIGIAHCSSLTSNSAMGIGRLIRVQALCHDSTEASDPSIAHCSLTSNSAMGIGRLNSVHARYYSTDASDSSGFSCFLSGLFLEEYDALNDLLASFSMGAGKQYEDALGSLETLLVKSHLPISVQKKILSRYKGLLSDLALHLVKDAEKRALSNVVDLLTSGMGSNESKQVDPDPLKAKELVISASFRPRMETAPSKVAELAEAAVVAGAKGYDVVPCFACLVDDADPFCLKNLVEGSGKIFRSDLFFLPQQHRHRDASCPSSLATTIVYFFIVTLVQHRRKVFEQKGNKYKFRQNSSTLMEFSFLTIAARFDSIRQLYVGVTFGCCRDCLER